MAKSPNSLNNTHQGAFIFLAIVTAGAFAVTLLIAAINGASSPFLDALPLAVVAALWAIPFMGALAKGESWAFILYIAVLIFVTEGNFRSREWDDKSFDWQVMMKGLTWLGAGVIGFLRLGDTWQWIKRPPALWALIFLVFLALSTAWSPEPAYTLLSAGAFLCLFLFSFACVQQLSEKQLMAGLLIGLSLVIVPSLAIAPFGIGITEPSPGSTGELDRLRGLTEHPIPLAEDAALLAFLAGLAIARKWRGRLFFVLLFAASVTVVLLTQSRIPPLAMIAAALLAWSYSKGGLPLLLPMLVGVVLLVWIDAMWGLLTILPGEIMSSISRSGRVSEITTLSGRLDIWPYVLDRFWEHPLIGFGHASGAQVLEPFPLWKITHAHNVVLQALLYTGLIGTALLIMAFLGQLRVFLASPNMFRDALFLYALVKGFTEQSMLSNMPSSSGFAWMLTVALSAKGAEALRKRKSPNAALHAPAIAPYPRP